jgi:2',3'-cyclic-nucleotide 2'-phosphodiesterase (5'-nucleotidase family)
MSTVPETILARHAGPAVLALSMMTNMAAGMDCAAPPLVSHAHTLATATTGDYNECPGISGPIVDIVKKLDKAVDLVVSGHTHRAYNCRIDGRLVTSGDKYGTIVTEIDLVLDPKSGDVTSAKAANNIVRTESASPRTRARPS